jgi:hypothetical protein
MKRSVCAALMAVSLLGTTAATARAPKKPVAGVYKGKTAQKQNIKVRVKTKGKCASFKAPCISKIVYKANFKCYDLDDNPTGAANGVATTLRNAPIRKNKLDGTFGGSGDEIKFKIKFNGKKASGSLHEVYSSKGGDDCYSEPPADGVVKFSVKR